MPSTQPSSGTEIASVAVGEETLVPEGTFKEGGSAISTTNSSIMSIHQPKIACYMQKRITPKFKKNIDDKLLRLFTDCFQPFRIVEEAAFRDLVLALNPSYQLPSRHTISRTMIPALYEECVFKTKELLKMPKKLCLTTDCWTSCNMESFMATTAHFLNDDFQQISLLLDCSTLSVQHTAANLAEELRRLMSEWNIQNRVLLIVSDNAANIKASLTMDPKMKSVPLYIASNILWDISKEAISQRQN